MISCSKPNYEMPSEVPMSITQTINWVDFDINLIDEAKKQNKFLFVWFYINDCTPCNNMTKMFKDPEVTTGLNKTTIAVRINVKQYPEIYIDMVRPGFDPGSPDIIPAIALISPNGMVFITRGEMNESDILTMIFKMRNLTQSQLIKNELH